MTVASGDYLALAMRGAEGKSTTSTGPTSYNEEQDTSTSGSGAQQAHCSVALSSQGLTSITSEDPGVFTMSRSDGWSAFTILVAEAVSGAGSSSPAVIARSFTVDAVTLEGKAEVSPAATVRSFTVDAVTVAGKAEVSPAVTARSFVVDGVTVEGKAEVFPSAITQSFTVDAVTTTNSDVGGGLLAFFGSFT